MYASTWIASSNYPTTSYAIQKQYEGGNSDIAVSKLSSTGALLASTYLGGRGGENPEGIYVDASEYLFLTGDTSATNFLITSNAWYPHNEGNHDAVIVMLSPDFSSLLCSTYLGGSSYDNGRSGFLSSDVAFYLTGSSGGSGWPTSVNAFQHSFAGGFGDYGAGDVIVAKISTIHSAKDGFWKRIIQ